MGGMNAPTKQASRTAVSANGLRKAYGEKVVLDGVDLSIGQGEVFAVDFPVRLLFAKIVLAEKRRSNFHRQFPPGNWVDRAGGALVH